MDNLNEFVDMFNQYAELIQTPSNTTFEKDMIKYFNGQLQAIKKISAHLEYKQIELLLDTFILQTALFYKSKLDPRKQTSYFNPLQYVKDYFASWRNIKLNNEDNFVKLVNRVFSSNHPSLDQLIDSYASKHKTPYMRMFATVREPAVSDDNDSVKSEQQAFKEFDPSLRDHIACYQELQMVLRAVSTLANLSDDYVTKVHNFANNLTDTYQDRADRQGRLKQATELQTVYDKRRQDICGLSHNQFAVADLLKEFLICFHKIGRTRREGQWIERGSILKAMLREFFEEINLVLGSNDIEGELDSRILIYEDPETLQQLEALLGYDNDFKYTPSYSIRSLAATMAEPPSQADTTQSASSPFTPST